MQDADSEDVRSNRELIRDVGRELSSKRPASTHPDKDIVGRSERAVHNPFAQSSSSDVVVTDTETRGLPVSMVEHIGVRTRKGNVRYDLAILARAAALLARYGERIDDLEYDQGFIVQQYSGEFIASIKSLARTVHSRLFKQTLYPNGPASTYPDKDIVGRSDAPTFKRFYSSVRKDMQRRVMADMSDYYGEIEPVEDTDLLLHGIVDSLDGYLQDIGHAAFERDVKGKGRDKFGKRLTLGTGAERAIYALEDAPLNMVQATLEPDEIATEGDCAALTWHMEEVAAYEFKLHRAFTHAYSWHGKGTPWRPAESHSWQNRMRRRSKAFERKTRHISVGAFRKLEAEMDTSEVKRNRACTMPYVIADIDASTPEESLGYAHRLLDQLEELGAASSEIVVSYTGGKGFHVRIPSGMLGNPIFREATAARRVVRRFFELMLQGESDADESDEEPSLLDVIDTSKFSPNTLIRAIGSVHENTGRWCVGFDGEEFKNMPLWMIQTYSSAMYTPCDVLPDPAEAEAVDALCELLDQAAREVQNLQAKSAGEESRGIIDRIREGVSRGEEFADGYVGRNYAALLLSLNLIQRYPEDEAWEHVREWNQRNSPPLGQHPEDDKNELEYQFNRAKAYAFDQASSNVPQ